MLCVCSLLALVTQIFMMQMCVVTYEKTSCVFSLTITHTMTDVSVAGFDTDLTVAYMVTVQVNTHCLRS